MGRIVLAGLLAGLAVWIWGFVSHVVLPIGQMGFDSLPPDKEPAIVDALRDGVPESGLYFIPGGDPKATGEEMEAWYEKMRQGPYGLLVIEPGGVEPMEPKSLVMQLVANVLGMTLAGFVVSLVGGSYGLRAFVVFVMGCFALLTINVPYWIWYRFPSEFTLGQALDVGVGALVGGLVVAGLVPRPGQ